MQSDDEQEKRDKAAAMPVPTEVEADAAVETPTQEVNDLDTFVRLLASWHGKRVKRLEGLLMTQEGTKVTMNDTDEFTLEGENLKAFRFGVAMSLSQLGTLPFEAEYEEPSPDAKPH